MIPTPIDQFELLMHGVQAMRRHVERLACPIQGGSGVRAQFYPHQIQNVQRILTSTRIRHLIADEVGMGKTIQALMVANALRLQKGRLRVRVVVGRGELQSQWSEEVCRAHQIVWDKPVAVYGDDWFEIVNESSIESYASTFNASAFDLLILDEPQSLKVDTLRYVAEHSSEFSRLLLLTASPELRSIERFCELLQMLEPERIERARRELHRREYHVDTSWSKSRLRDLDETELNQIFHRFESGCAADESGAIDTSGLPEGVSPAYASFAIFRRLRLLIDSRWKYRTVLRSYRSDYPDHLPRRRPKSFAVEPTEAERRRMELARAFVHRHLGHSPDGATTMLRRAAVGGESLQAQMRLLRKGQWEDDPRLEEIAKLAGREYCDARLDFLIDWLVRFWQDDPSRKVLIAAQDNPTVDELVKEIEWRIPEVGPRGNRKRLTIVTARDERDLSAESDHEFSDHSEAMRNIASSQLREFEMQESQLLVAHDVFRQSYNLQSADAILFFSLPWKPEDVDQWIGRVDRLGRGFIDPERRSSPPKPIQIVSLHRRGDPTIQLEEVFNEFRIFETAIDPERKLMEAISNRVHARVLEQDSSENGDTGQDLDARTLQAKEVQVPSGGTWNVLQAIEQYERVAFGDAAEPQLRHCPPLGFVSNEQEQCLASWVRLLQEHRQVSTRKSARRFTGGNRRGIFYTLSQLDCKGIDLPSFEDTSQSFPAFFIARRNVFNPPRVKVTTGYKADDTPRDVILQFLSHGSPLHEELISTFRSATRSELPLGIALFSLGPRYYPSGTSLAPGVYLCGVGFIDSASVYVSFNAVEELLQGLPEDPGARRMAMRENEGQRFQAAVEADVRLVRTLAPTKSCCLAFRDNGEPCTERDAADLLTPAWSHEVRANSQSLRVAANLQEGLPMHFRISIVNAMKRAWNERIEYVRQRIEERIEMIRIEAFDALWNVQSAIDETSERIEELEANATEQNAQTLKLTYLPRYTQFKEQLSLIERGRDLRCELLQRSLDHLSEPRPNTVELQSIAVIELQPDPEPMIEEQDDGPAANEFATSTSSDDQSTGDSADFQRPPQPR